MKREDLQGHRFYATAIFGSPIQSLTGWCELREGELRLEYPGGHTTIPARAFRAIVVHEQDNKQEPA